MWISDPRGALVLRAGDRTRVERFATQEVAFHFCADCGALTHATVDDPSQQRMVAVARVALFPDLRDAARPPIATDFTDESPEEARRRRDANWTPLEAASGPVERGAQTPSAGATSRFRVSDAATADYPAFVRLFPELGVPDPLPSVEHFSKTIAPQAIFARDGDAVVGYAWARPRGQRLHVCHVITDPTYRRRGVGRALMGALSRRARAAGFQRWMLNVRAENEAAIALYESYGMRVVLESASLRLAWAGVSGLPTPPAGATTRALAPSDDARFELALGLSPGDFSTCRASPGRVFLGAEVDGCPVACVAFDPAFPGAPVLRARSPAYARLVLDGLRQHALHQHDGFFVLVEGDPALEAALVGVGGEVKLRLRRMEGDV